MTRSEAMSIGAKRFNTGKPCKHGHFADRFVHNYSCVECNKLILVLSRQRKPALVELRVENEPLVARAIRVSPVSVWALA